MLRYQLFELDMTSIRWSCEH